MYWVPLLGLYTGCRLNEICQIHLIDMKLIKKVWCLSINTDSDDKRIKNISSKRTIPIAQPLIELGFISYLENLDKLGVKRVFHELTLGKNGYSRNLSRFFNETYLPKLGIKKRGKNFHSFRHTLTNHLKQKGIPENFVDELTGHKWDTMTFGTYSQRYEPKVLLKECVSKISFDLNLKGLKVNDWEGMLSKNIKKVGITFRNNEIDSVVKVMRKQKDSKGNPMSYRKISEVLEIEHGFHISHDTVSRILKEG